MAIVGFVAGISVTVCLLMLWASWAMVEKDDNGDN